MADELPDLIATARLAAPDVPQEVWDRVENAVRRKFKAQSIYIASRRKRNVVQTIEAAGKDADIHALADMLGLSVRRVQQIRQMLWQ